MDDSKENIYSCSFDKTIRVWSFNSSTSAYIESQIIKDCHGDNILTLLKTKDGLLYSGSQDNTIVVWKLLPKEEDLTANQARAPTRQPTRQATVQANPPLEWSWWTCGISFGGCFGIRWGSCCGISWGKLAWLCSCRCKKNTETINSPLNSGLEYRELRRIECEGVVSNLRAYGPEQDLISVQIMDQESSTLFIKKINSQYQRIYSPRKKNQVLAESLTWGVFVDPLNTTQLTIESFGFSNYNFCKDSIQFKGVENIFSDEQNLINTQGLEELIDDFIERKRSTYKSTTQLNEVFHQRLNIPYLCVVAQRGVLLRKALDEFGYEPFLYSEGFDPLLVALDHKCTISLDAFGGYFNSSTFKSIINNFIVTEGLKSGSALFRKLVADTLLIREPPDGFSMTLPEDLLTEEDDFYRVISCKDYLSYENIEEIKAIYSKEGATGSYKRVNYYHSPCSIDLRFSSKFISELLVTLGTVEDDILEGKIGFIIKDIWEAQKYKILAYSFVNWVHAALLFMGVIWFNGSTTYSTILILYIIVWVMLVVYEVLVFYRSPKMYVESPENFVDGTMLILGMVQMLIINPMALDDASTLYNLYLQILLLVTGARSVTHCRVFDGVRYLIKMMIYVFFDMYNFLIVLSGAILVFAALGIHINKTTDDGADLSLGGYLSMLGTMYDLGYGNWGEISELNLGGYIHFILCSVFLPLIMFNLLIAIISSTYERFTEGMKVVELRVLIQILVEWNHFVNFNQGKLSYDTDQENYIQLIIQEEADEDDLAEGLEEIVSKVGNVEERIERIESHVGEILGLLKKENQVEILHESKIEGIQFARAMNSKVEG